MRKKVKKVFDVHCDYACPEDCSLGMTVDEIKKMWPHMSEVDINKIHNLKINECFDYLEMFTIQRIK